MKRLISALTALVVLVTSLFAAAVPAGAYIPSTQGGLSSSSYFGSKMSVWGEDGKYTENGMKKKDDYYTIFLGGYESGDERTFAENYETNKSIAKGGTQYRLTFLNTGESAYTLAFDYDYNKEKFTGYFLDSDGEKVSGVGTVSVVKYKEREHVSYNNIAVIFKKNKTTNALLNSVKKSDKVSGSIMNVFASKKRTYYGISYGFSAKCSWGGKKEEEKPVVNSSKVTVSAIKDVVYTGKKLTPKVVVKYAGKTLKENKDYIVAYKNNIKVGKATVTIQGMGSKYSSILTQASFKIVPPKTTLTVARSGDKVKLSWKKVSNVTEYQICYSDDNGKTFKELSTVSNIKTDLTVGLNTSKSYQFKVRAVKTISGKNRFKWNFSRIISLI